MAGSSFSGKVAGARRALGDYSAIVKKQETDVWAEDEYGKTIAEGEAGVDDDVVIQKSENCVEKNGEGILFIKSGVYSINSSITISGNNISIVGESGISTWIDKGTIFKVNGDIDCVFKLLGSKATPPHNNMISNISIWGNNTKSTGIVVKYQNEPIIKNVVIRDIKGYAININSIHSARFFNVLIYNCGDNTNLKPAVWISDDADKSTNIIFDNIVIQTCEYGWIHQDESPPVGVRSHDVVITNSYFEDDGIKGEYGIVTGMQWHITDCTFVGDINHAFVRVPPNSAHNIIQSNVFYNGGGRASSGSDGQLIVSGDRTVISNNIFKDATYNAISMSNWDITIENNIIYNVGNDGIYIVGGSRHIIKDNIIDTVAVNVATGRAIDTFGSNEIIANNLIYNCMRGIRLATHIGNIFVINNKFVSVTYPLENYGNDNIIRNNLGYPTDSFLYTGLSVAVGGGSYGSATEIKSLSGIIMSFDAILHVTAGVDEVITVKFECVWDDGTTTYITKSLDNSSGTAAASQDFVITAADKIALWKNNSSLRKINVYAMSNLNPPTTSAKVTVDIAGSG